MFSSLRPHWLQHARLPCPSPTPGACSNSFPLSQWWHPTISSSIIPFSSCLQSFPASGSFPMSQVFASGGQSIVASVSASWIHFPTVSAMHVEWPESYFVFAIYLFLLNKSQFQGDSQIYVDLELYLNLSYSSGGTISDLPKLCNKWWQSVKKYWLS